MARRRRCVWKPGKMYYGRNGGKRRIVSVSEHNLTVEIVDPADSARFVMGEHIEVRPQTMVRWTAESSKTIELVDGGE